MAGRDRGVTRTIKRCGERGENWGIAKGPLGDKNNITQDDRGNNVNRVVTNTTRKKDDRTRNAK